MLKLYRETPEIPAPTIGQIPLPSNGTFSPVTRGSKIFFISLGCPRNLVDSEVMLGILLQAGYEAAPELRDADYIVINTCGFLEASRNESLETIHTTLLGKKEAAKVIVTGCMVQTHSDVVKKEFPQIDYLLGSGDVEGILKAVETSHQGEEVTAARSYLESGEVPRQVSTPKHYAYLKIAEGCRKRCSYCIIPEIKGPLKSKPKERILSEFNILLERGVQEIILIAQDLGDYGRDLGGRKCEALVDLIKSILTIEKPFWLRLLYLYPDEITDELIALMKSDSRICPYLDMPIQHVSDKMLQSMRRTTSKKDIIETIEKLRKEIPAITIRTSLIVGFPGETEEDFAELCEFVKAYPLDNIGIFRYSREPKSHSYDLPDQIPEEIKEARYHKLMQIQQNTLTKLNKKWLKKTIPVVIEGYHPESKYLMVGRHAGQCPEIDGQVIINDTRGVTAFGKIYPVKISETTAYDLIGKVDLKPSHG